MGAINERGDWKGGWWNYIKLKDRASPDQVLAKINGFVKTYMGYQIICPSPNINSIPCN